MTRSAMEVGAELVFQLASVLFATGLSAAKDHFLKKRTLPGRQSEGRLEKDPESDASDASPSCGEQIAEGGSDPEEDVNVAVGMELAMKAQRRWMGWKSRRNDAFKGLSAEFAAHRRQTQQGLSEIAVNQQSASQAIAEELVGVRSDLCYNADQLTRGVVAVQRDIGSLVEKVDGIWNDVGNGLLEVNYAVREGAKVVYRSLEDLRGDMAEMKLAMDETREENYHYFTEVASRLHTLETNIMTHQKQQNRSRLQNSLREAQMHLNNFTAAGGEDFETLGRAHGCCITILSLQPDPDTLDAHFMAGVIAIATSYTKHARKTSPVQGKKTAFRGDFLNITRSFKHVWADPQAARDSTWTAVVTYLLDMASAICMLPPEGVLLPHLDSRLVQVFGEMCSSQPSLVDRFPEIGGAALRALLQAKPLHELCRVSTALEVDTSMCDNKADVIQVLFDGRKPMDAALKHIAPRTDPGEPSIDDGEMEEEKLQPSFGSSHGRKGPRGRFSFGAGFSGSAAGSDTSEDEGADKPTQGTDKERSDSGPTSTCAWAPGSEPWARRRHENTNKDPNSLDSFLEDRDPY